MEKMICHNDSFHQVNYDFFSFSSSPISRFHSGGQCNNARIASELSTADDFIEEKKNENSLLFTVSQIYKEHTIAVAVNQSN